MSDSLNCTLRVERGIVQHVFDDVKTEASCRTPPSRCGLNRGLEFPHGMSATCRKQMVGCGIRTYDFQRAKVATCFVIRELLGMLGSARECSGAYFSTRSRKMNPQVDPREIGLGTRFFSTRFALSQRHCCQLLQSWPLLRRLLQLPVSPYAATLEVENAEEFYLRELSTDFGPPSQLHSCH